MRATSPLHGPLAPTRTGLQTAESDRRASTDRPGESALSALHQQLGNAELLAALQTPTDGLPRQLAQQVALNLGGVSARAADMGNQALLRAMRGEGSFCGEAIPEAIQRQVDRRLGAPEPGEASPSVEAILDSRGLLEELRGQVQLPEAA